MKSLIFFLILALGSCTDPERAHHTLDVAGYTSIQTGGYASTSCGDGDATCTSFTAIGPTGRPVSGAVGCGRSGCGKGCTIRID